VVNGREYALMGTYNGVSIVDVSDPDNPNNLFDVEHEHSQWREIKTFDHYAYATNENGDGVLIIDLQYLPDSVKQYQFIYDPPGPDKQTTGHTLWIDEKGRLFVFGGNVAQGYTCFDLTVDPLSPPYLGQYSSKYIHDGFVRGDTLWASEIFNGKLEVLDVSDPLNPESMASFSTPSNFTHNSWPTHDNHYLFTTDEVDDSYLTSYDVSHLDNVTELDKAQSNPGSNVIIHNVHLYDDQYAYVAYYKDGVVLFDVSRPENMVIVGSYDTDPEASGGEYGGTWGVYPWLPSGNIIASDFFDAATGTGKLTILTPVYVTACWLEGNVTDSVTDAPLNNVFVEILSTTVNEYSNLVGNYKTGIGIEGQYQVKFSKEGYEPKTLTLDLVEGAVTLLDVELVPLAQFPFSGQVLNANTGEGIPSASVMLDGGSNGVINAVTDASGNFSIASMYGGEYDVYAGKWGFRTNGIFDDPLDEDSPPLVIYLDEGYYDDFLFNFNWSASGGNGNSGKWVRGEPDGTSDQDGVYNPDEDVANDFGTQCFMTGNGGGSPGTSDVDDVVVNLISPVFDLSTYEDPYLHFNAWWVDAGPFGPPDDTLHISLSNGNITAQILELSALESEAAWKEYSFRIADFLEPTSAMTLKLSTVDYEGDGNANWIEAALDLFEVTDSVATSVDGVNGMAPLGMYPNPFADQVTVYWQPGPSLLEVTDVSGKVLERYEVSKSESQTVGELLPPGIYFVRLRDGNELVGAGKIMKQ
jgi:choice-of-anchor B domain-containing protein